MTRHEHKVHGGCLCGDVRFESDQPPFRVGYCHCRMCQRGTGNIFGTAAFFVHSHFTFTQGEPTWFQSSDKAARGFCARCGSPIAYQHQETEHVAIWLGCLDHPEQFEPQVHWYSDTKLPWVDIHADLPDATTDLASFADGA